VTGTPTVTAIVTFWNRADYLSEAVDSVLSQDIPAGSSLEVVLVDDGSDDESAEVARRYAPPARLVEQENRGSAGATNTGVREARGEFVAFCDSDDLWLPGKLASQLVAVAGDAELDMVFVHVEEFLSPDVDPNRIRTRQLRAPMPGYLPSCVLLRREAFEQVGVLDESLRNGAWMNWYARARAEGLRELVLEPVLVRRRIHARNNWAMQERAALGYVRALRESVHRQREEA
jgi:glycosyltransferase involved in cell wall biosynthesis